MAKEQLFLASKAIGIDELLEKFTPLEKGGGKTITVIPNVDTSGFCYLPEKKEREKRYHFLISREFEIQPINPAYFDSESIQRVLDKSTIGLFVEGGDTWRLLEAFQRLGIPRLLPDFFARGGFIIGASAGSMIVGPSIELTSHHPLGGIDHLGLESNDGLKLTNLSVWPHYEEWHEDIISGLPNHLKEQNITRLRDNQAVVIADNKESTIVETGSSQPRQVQIDQRLHILKVLRSKKLIDHVSYRDKTDYLRSLLKQIIKENK